MKRTFLALVLAVASLSGLAVVRPADAASTYARQCVLTLRVTFSRPLTKTLGSGTMSYTYTPTCAREYTNGATGTETYTWTGSVSYTGSCISASIDDPTNPNDIGVLIGGTTMIRAGIGLLAGVDWAGEWTLVADGLDPCNMAKATAVSASAGVHWGTIP